MAQNIARMKRRVYIIGSGIIGATIGLVSHAFSISTVVNTTPKEKTSPTRNIYQETYFLRPEEEEETESQEQSNPIFFQNEKN